MVDDITQAPAAFVTFYSFKGGVGRSMALINVAGILAGRGFRVLALDLDLEAPGISYLMQEEAKQANVNQPGFVDLLADACARGPEADLFALDPTAVVERYSYVYTVPDAIRQSDEGLLRIMPAGKLDGGYQALLDALALGQLYRNGHGQPLIAAFKQVLQESKLFDFVLIDSRTGFSDEAGICTRDLADCLIVIMGLNRQNVEGTATFFRALREAQVSKRIRVALSPVPNGEDELVEQREQEAARALSSAYGQTVDLSLKIPYHPRLAVTEEPHTFRRSRGYLYDAYARIENAVLQMVGYTPDAIRFAINNSADNKRLDDVLQLLKILRKLEKSTDDFDFVVEELVDLCSQEDAGELRRWLAASLPSDSSMIFYLAEVFRERGLADADLFFQRAIEIDPSVEVLSRYAIFLDYVCKDYDRAEAIYKRILQIEPGLVNMRENYAILLTDVRKDYKNAEKMHKKSFERDPQNTTVLGNYAKCLFLLERFDHAAALLDNAFGQNPDKEALLCELHFYAYAHAWKRWPKSLGSLKNLLQSGANSKDWKLQENVRVAMRQGHPAPEFLTALANVVSGKASIETLNVFPEWQQAQQTSPEPEPQRR